MRQLQILFVVLNVLFCLFNVSCVPLNRLPIKQAAVQVGDTPPPLYTSVQNGHGVTEDADLAEAATQASNGVVVVAPDTYVNNLCNDPSLKPQTPDDFIPWEVPGESYDTIENEPFDDDENNFSNNFYSYAQAPTDDALPATECPATDPTTGYLTEPLPPPGSDDDDELSRSIIDAVEDPTCPLLRYDENAGTIDGKPIPDDPCFRESDEDEAANPLPPECLTSPTLPPSALLQSHMAYEALLENQKALQAAKEEEALILADESLDQQTKAEALVKVRSEVKRIKKLFRKIGRGIKKAAKAVAKGVKNLVKGIWHKLKCRACKTIMKVVIKKGCKAISSACKKAGKICLKLAGVCIAACKIAAKASLIPLCVKHLTRLIDPNSLCTKAKFCK